jgi:hypothetical protein
MKRCPTCNRTFTDPSLSFCIDDGTPLLKDFATAPDPEATIVGASSTNRQTNAGAGESAEESTASDQGAPAYQPPGQFAPTPAVRGRRAWPWVVGIVVLLLIGAAGIGIAAMIVIPKMIQAANNENVNTHTGQNANGNGSANANSDTNTNSSANENNNQNANANTNANAGQAAEPPTDEDEVLSDLTDLEKEWTEANFNADKKALARILADDYVGTQNGRIQGKADYLRDIQPDHTVTDWEFKELKLTLNGDRATLKGKMRQQHQGVDEDQVDQFTDKFVWRDERWQAVASEVERLK